MQTINPAVIVVDIYIFIFLDSPELPMVPAAHTETKRAFEPNIEGSTSFCISAAVSKEFPKPDVVNSSLAASTPEDEAGEPNTSMDNPINVSMKGRIEGIVHSVADRNSN